MGELNGYARVSSVGQKLDVQIAALTAAGVSAEHLYSEKASGTKRDGRQALDELLTRGIRNGDTLVVTRLDRLARSSRDLHNIARTLTSKDVDLRVLEQAINTTTPGGACSSPCFLPSRNLKPKSARRGSAKELTPL